VNRYADYNHNHKLVLLGFIAIAIATIAAYWDIVHHEFLQWDDMLYIHNNKYIQSLSIENLYWMFTNYDVGNWHPLTWLTLAIDFEIWGYNPVAFKFVNVFIHIFNSLLVYYLTYTLLQLAQRNHHADANGLFSRVRASELSIASLLTAMLFAIHPQHVESVSWIAERKEVLCGLFFLATILAYLKYKATNNKKWLTISTIMFFCSLMAKPMAVTIPLVLILVDIYPLKTVSTTKSFKQNIKLLYENKLIFFLLSAFVALITLFTQRHGIQGSEYLPLDSRLINACMAIILYIYKFFWPANLSPFYPFHNWSLEPGIFSIIPVLAIVSITATLLALIRKNIYFPAISALYILITLLPVIGIIKVGSQAAADRYTYLSLLSLFVILGGGLSMVIHFLKEKILAKTAFVMVTVTVIITFGIFTFKQNEIWKTDQTLWDEAIQQYPGTADRAYSNLGEVHLNKGNYPQAINNFHKALAIQPENSFILEKTGKAYQRLNNDKLAAHYFKTITRIYPESSRGYLLLGDLFYSRKILDQAKNMYNKAFYLTPNAVPTLQRKALVDYLDGNLHSAMQKTDYLLAISPNSIGGLQLSAKIHLKANNLSKAAKIADKILDLKPDDSFATELLATINQIKQ
jgi:Tfp pilus assembly protein PilF